MKHDDRPSSWESHILLTVTPAKPGMADVTTRLDGRIAFGGDYNPEQWPAEVWREDALLMRQANVNLVTVGVFSWAWLQPEPTVFEFGWLDDVLGILHDAGIAVDLANASASPPPWFSHRYPDSLPVDADGRRLNYGGRQAFCPSSADYRDAAAELTQRIVDRYADHPALAMWHVHNEYGCHNPRCFCETSAAAFRTWLQQRYDDLPELNDAWGTAFWSQRYSAWEQVIPPRRTTPGTFPNPGQQLDFARFCSDELLACFQAEAAIIRARSALPVTTNYMGFFEPLDYWQWSENLDLISNDHYRITDLGDRATQHLVMAADLTRSLASGGPWLLMEHSTSAVNWQPRNPAKPAGQLRRDSLTHVARGADGALYFQWRAAAAGTERFHSAMLPHAGTDSRRWQEVVSLGEELVRLSTITGTRLIAKTAILLDWPAWWAANQDSLPSQDARALDLLADWHDALYRNGITCDFAHPRADLSGYDVVLVPALHLSGDELGSTLQAVVDRGGSVVVGFFSGIADEHNRVRTGGYPALLRGLLGITVEEFSPLPADEVVGLLVTDDARSVAGPPMASSGSVWTELIRVDDPASTQAAFHFDDGVFTGEPAITVRRPTGDDQAGPPGSAWYLGTRPDPDTLAQVLLSACDAAGVRGLLPYLPPEVDRTLRVRDAERFLFLINHSGADVPLEVRPGGAPLGTAVTAGRPDLVPAKGVLILRLHDDVDDTDLHGRDR